MNVKPYDFQVPRILHIGTEATLQQFCHILKSVEVGAMSWVHLQPKLRG